VTLTGMQRWRETAALRDVFPGLVGPEAGRRLHCETDSLSVSSSSSLSGEFTLSVSSSSSLSGEFTLSVSIVWSVYTCVAL